MKYVKTKEGVLSEKQVNEIIVRAMDKINLTEAMIIYEAECILTVSGDRNITDVLTDIRGLEGVTIVNIQPGGGEVGASGIDAEKVRVKFKFLKGRYSLRFRLASLVSKIKEIKGLIGIRIFKTRPVEV
tara:strand:+ start:5313 stop:5699 length:387 start_codon:yes stop_codon:yes gene_type:complete